VDIFRMCMPQLSTPESMIEWIVSSIDSLMREYLLISLTFFCSIFNAQPSYREDIRCMLTIVCWLFSSHNYISVSWLIAFLGRPPQKSVETC
jgi:hypothetical protein